jgi:hypothetical protein
MEQIPLFTDLAGIQWVPTAWFQLPGHPERLCDACQDKIARGEVAVCSCVRTSTTTAGDR